MQVAPTQPRVSITLTYLCHVTVLSPGASAQSRLQVTSVYLSPRLKTKGSGHVKKKKNSQRSTMGSKPAKNYEGWSKPGNMIHSKHFLAVLYFILFFNLCYFCPKGDSQLQSHRYHRQCTLERDLCLYAELRVYMSGTETIPHRGSGSKFSESVCVENPQPKCQSKS